VRAGCLLLGLAEWAAVARPGSQRTERRELMLRLREHAAAGAQGLTLREREVLALVAEGLTNAEVARALWVAESTVAKHLERAFPKLGVHTRTAAAAQLWRLSE
jgi:DNA-binding CsgD family transcriptional regulator